MIKVILSLLIVIIACTVVSAAQFDINYFNGVKWGSKINSSNGFKLISTGTLGEKFYSRSSDKNLFEGIKVEAITYVVKKGRFSDANFVFSGQDSYNKVRALLVKKFMKSERPGEGLELFRLFNGKRFVNAMLQYHNGSGLVNLHFTGESAVNSAYKTIENLNK